MELYGLLGWPVKHSVSPQMQEAGFRAAGIEARYLLHEVPPERLGEKVAELKAAGYSGWNVTIPHKRQILDFLDGVDPAAAAAGSVNTVRYRDGKSYGWSTDGYGLARALEESFGLTVPGGRFVFWGTGGATTATSVYFACQGAARLLLVNRTLDKALQLRHLILAQAPACEVQVLSPEDIDSLKSLLRDFQGLIQGSSVGLKAGDPLAVPEKLLLPHLAVLDMIYRPTALLGRARERGCRVADGRGMLLYQGVRSWSLWTGREAPVEPMRQALDAALAARG